MEEPPFLWDVFVVTTAVLEVVFFHDFPRTTEFVSVTNTTGQRFFTKG